MARWTIYDADKNWLGGINLAESEAEAVEAWNANLSRPMEHITYHAELDERGTVENLHYEGEGNFRKLMCTYTPRRIPAATAQMMREVWMDAGYALIPA